MDNAEVLSRARRIHSQRSKEQRDSTIWYLSWRGGGASTITGYGALATELNLKESSIPVLLSKAGGTSFTLERTNPLTGEADILEVIRAPLAKPESKRRGRPSKRNKTDPRLGDPSNF